MTLYKTLLNEQPSGPVGLSDPAVIVKIVSDRGVVDRWTMDGHGAKDREPNSTAIRPNSYSQYSY